MSGMGSTGKTSGIVICCCSGVCSALTSSMLIIYMLRPRAMHAGKFSVFLCLLWLFVALQYRYRRDIRFVPLRKMDLQQPVPQLGFRIFVVDRDLDRNFSSKMAIGALDAVVCFNTTARRALSL